MLGQASYKKFPPVPPLQRIYILSLKARRDGSASFQHGYKSVSKLVSDFHLTAKREKELLIEVFGKGSGEGVFTKTSSPNAPHKSWLF